VDIVGGHLKSRRGLRGVLGVALAASVCVTLPSATAADTILFRVNAGGTQIAGTPAWTTDTAASPSQYTNAVAADSRVFTTSSTVDMTHSSLPAGTPQAMLQTERWDAPGGAEMQWDFPVTPGPYEVRLYFAENFSGAQSVGARVFDVSVEGSVVLNDYDVFADVGGFKGVMKSVTVTSDSNLDIDFAHVVENPAIKGIEIVSTATAANTLGAQPSSMSFGSVTVGSTATQTLQVTNLGGSGAPNIVVSSTTITGTTANQFSDNFTDGSNVSLAPGQSTNIVVTFAPTSAGTKSATLSVAHSGSNSPVTVPLSGTGQAPLSGAWQTRASSGLNRQEVSYVQAGGKFYLAGGGTAHQVYNPQTNSWANVAPLPQALDHIQGAVVGGKIYYIGGLTAWPSPHVSTVHIYDPQTNSFTQGAPMPAARARGAGGVAVHQGKIYYAGGLHNGSAVSWFDVYDPGVNTWTQLPNMPRVRDHFHAAVVGGKFYAIGGRDTAINATTTANDAFDFSTGTWTQGLAPLPTARGGFAAAALGNEVLVIGGEGGGSTFSTVEAYNTQTNTWRTLAPMPTARHGIQAAECNGGVYIAAGGKTQGGASPSDVHEVFFLDGATSCGGASPPPVGVIAQDGFGRTVSSGWGTADVGGPWTVLNGEASNFSVGGGVGSVVTPANSSQQVAHLASVSARDVDIKGTIGFPGSATNRFAYFLLRRQSGGANMRIGIFPSGSKIFIRGQNDGGTHLFADVDTGLSFSPGDSLNLRIQVQGANPTTIRVRAWKVGTPEPTTSAVNTTSTVGPQTAGSVGVRTSNTAGTPTTITFDDILASLLP
jgi:N-acetylneuraminic acid mutarotase